MRQRFKRLIQCSYNLFLVAAWQGLGCNAINAAATKVLPDIRNSLNVTKQSAQARVPRNTGATLRTFLRRIGCAALFVGIILRVSGQESQPSEYQLKAAFLFNFAKFVDWPASAFTNETSPIVIGVLGENPFGDDLAKTLQKKTINNRPLVAKTIETLEEARNCHVLFICNSEKKRLREIFDSLKDSSVLTVGETNQFNESGGMIAFVAEGKKIRFQINDEIAKAAGLKISSKLLSLAIPASR